VNDIADPYTWRIIDTAFAIFIFLGGVIVSLLVFTGKRVIDDIDKLKDGKADKDAIGARFDEMAENARELVKKIDNNQQETTRLLLHIARNKDNSP
jgi:uncharacterized membrane protein (DUF106 family)